VLVLVTRHPVTLLELNMADSKVCKARKRLKTIATGITADGLTLLAAQIFLGNKALAADLSAPFDYALNRPVLHVAGAALGFSGSQYPLTVDCRLIVPLSAFTAQDWGNADNLVAALRAAWLEAGNYPEGEVKAKRCDFEPLKAEVRGDLTLLHVNLYVAFENPDA